MSEGLFLPSNLAIPGLPVDRLTAAVVRIHPKKILVLDVVATQSEARERTRNEARADGSECRYPFFTSEDVAKANDPEFAMGMVCHEFSELVRTGAKFPATVPLDGGSTGFASSIMGHVLTNYHLVTAEIANHGREGGALGTEVLCKTLRASVARRNRFWSWDWHEAKSVWLVSNPPSDRAIRTEAEGQPRLAEDTALLRIEPAPIAHLQLSPRSPKIGESIWMAGFPLRTARSEQSLNVIGYSDADGSLRVSTGCVTEVDGNDYFVSDADADADADGKMGNSGSPVFDASGLVMGVFSRTTGDGPRNAFEYGHVGRIQVPPKLAMSGMGMNTAVRDDGSPSAQLKR